MSTKKYPTLRKVNYKKRIEDMENHGLLKVPSTYKNYYGKRYRLVHIGGLSDSENLDKKIQKHGHQVNIEGFGIGCVVYMRDKKEGYF
ncbi:unnamed protein product [marine sediment metagenome]|uniref:Uncharacterized protein n=1 Tax=marine sediment metagenome TaxID=412755 RepID=X1RMM8_9ZZZZ